MLSSSRLSNIGFSIKGDNEIIEESVVDIVNTELFSGDEPFDNGVYDFRLGTTDNKFSCKTCKQKKDECLGHFGHIPLNYPVIAPMAFNDVKRWLSIICFTCGNVFVPAEKYMQKFPTLRFNMAKKTAEAAVGKKKSSASSNDGVGAGADAGGGIVRKKGISKNCVHCGTEHAQIRKDQYDNTQLNAEYFSESVLKNSVKLYPHIIADIFGRVNNETVLGLGRYLDSHPRNYVNKFVPVPPSNLRPDVKKVGSTDRGTIDSITTFIHGIVKSNMKIPPEYPSPMTVDFESNIVALNSKVHQMIRGTKSPQNVGQQVESVTYSIRWTGKHGRFRKDLLGKRVKKMARSTIIGDPTLKIGEIGIPSKFACVVKKNIVVRPYNRKMIMQYIENGEEQYPGASRILKKNTGFNVTIKNAKNLIVEDGDIVTCDYIDGDNVGFNRQPSLFISNISNMIIKVTPDLSEMDNTDESKMRPSLAIRKNVIACAWWNSDFDGDAMNIIYNISDYTAHEAKELGKPSNWFVSYANASTAVGQTDDSIIGMFELTKNKVKIDKFHAMMMFQRNTYLPSIVEDKIYSGKEVVSMALKETPVNYNGKPEYYNSSLAAFIKYDPEDVSTKIVEGHLKSGVLDKSAIGGGGTKNLYHIIANEYGAEKALDVIYDMQQITIGYIYQFGYTIGVMDMLVNDKARDEIHAISTDLINKSRLITEKLNNGEIIPPIGKTVGDFYEEQQIAALTITDEFTEPVLKNINAEDNNLFKLIMCGSKGKLANMYNMVSAIGQKIINGERIRPVFGHKRTMVYYPRFDTEPESRGYIANSYISGVTSAEYVSCAITARFDLITKALLTSVTGAQNRRSIKNLETIIVTNLKCAAKDSNIIQLVFGEDYMDVRRIEPVKFDTVMISNVEFEKQYRRSDSSEFALLKADRDKYRDCFLRLEKVIIGNPMESKKNLSFDMVRIIESALFSDFVAKNKSAATGEEIIKMVAEVNKFIDDFAYAITNERARQRRWELPLHMRHCTWLHCMHIRSHLCSAKFQEGYKSIIGVTGYMNLATLRVVLQNILLKYKYALIEAGCAAGIIAAQSFSEPLTQYMLDAHHRSATGGTSGDAMTKTTEVLGAKSIDKLSMPRMIISLDDNIAGDKQRVQEIANNIEALYFRQFVTRLGIFFERFGEPVHSAYRSERKMIGDFVAKNPMMKPPIDLVRWCIRYTINKTSLILKNVSLDIIVEKIRETFPDAFVVWTPENANAIFLRVYIRAGAFKDVNVTTVRDYNNKLLDCAVRGVKGIMNTTVMQIIKNRVLDDGSIEQDNNNWGISTAGTNISELLSFKYVDRYSIHTDAIQEVVSTFGIEAARLHIMKEMKSLAEKCDTRHLTLYADEMTYTGAYTSIDKGGIDKREERNILLRVGTSAPIKAVETAAVTSATDMITGVTSAFLLGTVPQTGSIYNSFVVNEDFIAANTKSNESFLDDL